MNSLSNVGCTIRGSLYQARLKNALVYKGLTKYMYLQVDEDQDSDDLLDDGALAENG